MPRIRPLFLLSHAALLLMPSLLPAQQLPPPSRIMYKCTVQGVTSYSDTPCLGATRMEVEPTRGVGKLSGQERMGQDVFHERQRELFAEGIRPLTGMDARQLSTRPEINVNFGKQSRMRCKATSAPQCEHCKHESTQQRAGSGSQKHIYFWVST